MGWETIINGKLADIINRLNSLTANSRKINELPAVTEGEKSFAVWNDESGKTEQMFYADILTDLAQNQSDRLLSIDGDVTIETDENTYTATVPLATWMINFAAYGNDEVEEITAALTAEGFTRYDLIVGNTENEIVRVQGTATEDVAVAPNIPLGTVLIAQIFVTHTGTEPVDPPIISDIYIKKAESRVGMITATSTATVLNNFPVNDRCNFSIYEFGAFYISDIKGLNFSAGFNADYKRPGQIFTFRNNNLTHDITFHHDDAAGIVKLKLIGGQDYVLKPSETIRFRLNNLMTEVEQEGVLNEDTSSNVIVRITSWSQLSDQELDSDKVYIIENQIEQTAGSYIIIPATGLTLKGYGFNVSTIFSAEVGEPIFTSPMGGSGDIVLAELSVTTIGIGSSVFDIEDSDGTHAVEIEYVNFSGCKSLGKIAGYRQGTITTGGIYGCTDGLMLSGSWDGFKTTNTNVFGFASSGTLFKKDTDTEFSNRVFLTLNVDFPTGAVLTDFVDDNFLAPELLQINSSMIKVNGSSADPIANAIEIVPNLSPNHIKCLWIGNIGLPDSATENFVEDNTVSGTHTINWLIDTHLLEMTGDTTFDESNLPASGKNTQEIKIYLTGAFLPTFPSAWLENAVGTYKGSDVNEISLKFVKTGLYFMKIANSLSVYPSPIVESLDPVSLVPSDTASLTIMGGFFTPETIVTIEGQTVNTVTFINPNELELSVTTGSIEGDFDLMISNGTGVVFPGYITVSLGVVFRPEAADWVDKTSGIDTDTTGEAHLGTFAVYNNATWIKEFDFTKDFRIVFNWKASPLGAPDSLDGYNALVQLLKVSDNSVYQYIQETFQASSDKFYFDGSGLSMLIDRATFVANPDDTKFYWEYVGGVMTVYYNGLAQGTLSTLSENLRLKVRLSNIDIVDIKYIELP